MPDLSGALDVARTNPAVGYFFVGLVVLVAVAADVIACAYWPLKICKHCDGRGSFEAQWGSKAWRTCRRCGGTGRTVRLGRRVYDFIRGKQKGAR